MPVLRRRRPDSPRLSFGEWDRLDSPVVAICHPDWRGVRTAAYGQRAPVVEVRDAAAWAEELAHHLAEAGVRTMVVQGWPPGSADLIRAASGLGLSTRCVLHSSMAQHGGEPSEARVVSEAVALLHQGTLGKLGFVKEGMAEVFRALGHAAEWVPNRLPPQPEFQPINLGEGLAVGVFAEPFWRKNVVTQLGAVTLIEDARAHVLFRPEVGYLETLSTVEHGLLAYEDFLRVQGSVDLNLYVTLSESYPLTPLESYAAGVPCLISRTSSVFADDRELWDLTTVERHDDPVAIARAAEHLLDCRDEAVERARAWIERWDGIACQLWATFVAE